MTKSEIRKEILTYRKQLDFREKSKRALRLILRLDFRLYRKIGIYYPLPYEIDILPIVSIVRQCEFYLPVTKEKLYFSKYEPQDELVKGPFHLLEPKGDLISSSELDCIFIPCVAISEDNKRLGYGKGYYDEALRNFTGVKIGVCAREFCHLKIAMESHDIALDQIIKV